MEDSVKTRGFVLAVVFSLSTVAIIAQVMEVTVKPLTDDDIKLIRQDIQSAKDGIIKDTMQFSPAEEAAFWPVYKQYAAEQHAIASKRLAVILDYAKLYDTMKDSDASALSERMLQVEDETQALRKKYLPKFEAALGGKRAAKFYQVDNRITMILNVQLASEVPLIP
jgi:hypothetical protein